MNKIYKVIYSKVRNCYVVVSELAKNHSRGTKAEHTARKGTALTAALLLALSCVSVLGAPGAEADTRTRTDGSNFIGVERTDGTFEDSSYTNYNGGGAEGPQSITIGTAAEAGNSTITIGDRRAGASIGSVYVGQGDIKNPFTDRGGWVTSVGYNSDATGYGSIAIGSNAIAKNDIKQNIELSNASGDLNDNPTIKGASVALGYSASAADGSIAIGSYSEATAAASTATAKFRDDTDSDYKAPSSYVSVGSSTLKRRITNVAAGADENDAATVGQLEKAKGKYYSAHDGIQLGTYKTNEDNDGASALAGLAAGYETGTAGIASTVVGSYSGVIGSGLQGAAAVSLGTVNVNINTDSNKTFSGVANSIIGQGNVTSNSNAAIILGAGNTIKDSYRELDTSALSKIKTAVGNKDEEALETAVQSAVPQSGAQVMAIGGGNTITSAYKTQVVGVGNTVSNTEKNYVDGFNNTVTGGASNYIIGAQNSLNGGSNNIVFGDNHNLGSQSNNVVIGSADSAKELAASDAVVIGHNADVKVKNGVALGSDSVASVAAGVAGYDPATSLTNKTTAPWTSTKAAVSVGTADGSVTRQITGVAAGTKDTDAVNVAQIKKLASIDASNIGSNFDGDKTANENAWGEALGTGTVDASSSQLVTGATVYSEVRPSTNGTYVHPTSTTGANLLSLDNQVKQNAQNISDNTYTQGDGILMDKTKKTISAKAGQGITVDTKGINVKTGNGLEIAKDGSVAIKTADSNLKVDSNGIGLGDKITIGSDKTKQVTIDGTKGEISGLTNTTWDSTANDYSKSTKAATESQVAAAVTDAVKQAGDNDVDTHVKAGSYGVDANHQVSMDIVDKKGKATGQKVTITDVAKASEVGDVTKLDKGVQNATGTTSVVDAINNLNTSMNTKIGDQNYSKSNTSGTNKYVSDGDSITSAIGKLDGAVQQAASAAGKHSTVSEGSNIKVDGNVQTDGHTDYKVSLKDDISLKNVTTKTATTDTMTVNNSATIGGVTIANKTISGLDDTKIEKGSTNAVNANTIYNELRPSADGTYIKITNTTAQNITNLDTQVKKNSDLVNSDGTTIKIGSKDSATKVDISDKNGKGRVVTGVVTDNNDASSAANVGYVNNMAAANTQQIYRDMNNAYGRLDNNINRAAAGSNALAALHPLEYDPDDKLSFAMGYGHYHNANAAAVGAFYQPDNKTQFNFGVALGNGDPGFNAGIAFKLGKPSPYAGMNRVTLIHTVQDLKASDEAKDKRIDALEKENQEMKKQLQAILAKLNG
ncbi:ESPR-type extended signal peptide-containing protein [Acidaminococcus timonensis]|uniref:ESPR-type extended signal peptide-containing protein n=1 Tax=Acidaminococcus timonensis TaxID=1871002 RepID=UPI0025F795EF|nr:ESPR-type extended signal peptide-containing protein [Acidaminococcus timonensis]